MPDPIAADLLVTDAAELLTFEDEGPGLVANAALAAHGGRVVWVGPTADADRLVALAPGGTTVDAAGQVVLPGLVDCHSHFVFAGDRTAEFAMRCGGASYVEIAAEGGGIRSSAEALERIDFDALVALGADRAERLLAQGITTSEAKSGYGLSVEGELRQLRAIRAVGERTRLEVRPTLLGLHALAAGMSRDGWLDRVCRELIPLTAREKLAFQFDAFEGVGAFTQEEVRRAFDRAAPHQLGLRLHCDQLGPGEGAQLAAAYGASADHLEFVSEAGIAALAQSHCPAVLMPLATLAVMEKRFAPFRALRDAGVTIALATNWNPGSAPSESAWLTVSLACLVYGMQPWEALRAFTAGGARVLGLGERLGRLAPGFDADFVVAGCRDHRHLASHAGVNHVRRVFKKGVEVVHSEALPCRDS